jgi:type VI secretion system secreted protein Hcp
MPLECALFYSDGIEGTNPKAGRPKSSNVIELNHEVYQPIDTQTGRNTGARVHGTVDVIAEMDTATVPLMQGLCHNTIFEKFDIVWYRLTGTTEEEYLRMSLNRVKVAAAELILPNTKEAKKEKLKHLMRLSFAYESVVWLHVDGFEFEDGWAVERA